MSKCEILRVPSRYLVAFAKDDGSQSFIPAKSSFHAEYVAQGLDKTTDKHPVRELNSENAISVRGKKK